MATGIQKKITKETKKAWAFFTLATKTQNYSINLFPEAYEECGHVESEGRLLLDEGRHLLVEAELVFRQDRGEWGVNAYRLSALEKRVPGLVKRVLFVLHPVAAAEDFLQKLSARLMAEPSGPTALQIGFRQADERVLQADIAGSLGANMTPEFFKEFSQHPACAGTVVETVPQPERERKWGGKRKNP